MARLRSITGHQLCNRRSEFALTVTSTETVQRRLVKLTIKSAFTLSKVRMKAARARKSRKTYTGSRRRRRRSNERYLIKMKKKRKENKKKRRKKEERRLCTRLEARQNESTMEKYRSDESSRAPREHAYSYIQMSAAGFRGTQ